MLDTLREVGVMARFMRGAAGGASLLLAAVILVSGLRAAALLDTTEPRLPQGPPDGASRAAVNEVPSGDRPLLLLAQKTVARKKKAAAGKPAPEEASSPAGPGSDGGLKFSRDIAPILVGNCIGCHNPERKRGKFDLTTYEKLMSGSEVEKVIEPGKPDESHLVLRLRGEETPKMPQGNNNNLSEEAIARVESWVKAGAKLDTGLDPKAPIKSYAPSPEQLRAAELKKLPVEQRDKLVETEGLKRWKQASPKTTPEITSSAHFVLFSKLSKDRTAAASKGLEASYTQLRTLLSTPSEPALDWAEKTSVLVFNDVASYIEFARTLENREIETGDMATANFAVKEPYIAVVDPLGGREEPAHAAGARKPARGRRGDDEGAALERNLTGLLGEQLAMGVLKSLKNTPGWVCLGTGAYFASALDPRSTYVHKLRVTGAALYQQGWTAKANDALGGQLSTDQTRAVGLACIDWMARDPLTRRGFPTFVRTISEEGGPKLDDVLQKVFNARRQDFLSSSGEWAARHGASR